LGWDGCFGGFERQRDKRVPVPRITIPGSGDYSIDFVIAIRMGVSGEKKASPPASGLANLGP
jgi:hypothetical protein